MNDHERMEFWKSLGHLYDETLALREVATAHQEAARNLHTACESLRDIAVAHEKRLDRIEVIQQWLTEKEQRREEQEGR